MSRDPTVGENEVYSCLKASAPFHALSEEELKALAQNARKIDAPPGTVIIREGERGDECYVIHNGEVEVLRGTGPPTRVTLLGPKAIFGEAALLTDCPRNATVKATKTTTLFAISGKTLSQAVDRDTALRNTFFELFSFRDRPQQREGITLHDKKLEGGDSSAILKNPENGKYFSLSEEGLFIWNLLDGNHDLRDLTLKHLMAFKTFAPHTIASLLAGLSQSGFVESRAAQALATREWGAAKGWQRWGELAKKILEWRCVIRNVDPWLTRLYHGGVRHLFTKPAQCLIGLLAVTGPAFFFLLTRKSGGLLTTTSLFLIPAFLVSALMHEAGHAFTTKAFGREVHSVGFGWYWFGPIFYVDTSDMWVAPKWPRIAVSIAGTYSDLLTAAFASIVGFVVLDPLISGACWIFALASYIVVLANLNPLMEYDGYYVLIDILERPNLRRHSLRWFKTEFLKTLINPKKVRGHLTEFLYGTSAILYLALVVIQAAWLYRNIVH